MCQTLACLVFRSCFSDVDLFVLKSSLTNTCPTASALVYHFLRLFGSLMDQIPSQQNLLTMEQIVSVEETHVKDKKCILLRIKGGKQFVMQCEVGSFFLRPR